MGDQGAIQSQGRDLFGAVGAPPCAGAFEPLLDEVTMGAFSNYSTSV
jgi:hypothetical protein